MPKTISETYGELSAQGRKALVAYVTAGDPDLDFTHDVIIDLEKAGVDIIELGVPFGCPVGDGPTIQRSAQRALDNRVSLANILPLASKLRLSGVELPIVLFSYHNPVFDYGYEALASEAAKAGISGILVVDLPPEESAEYRSAFNGAGLDTIFLATPMTADERLPLVREAASGFCYYVSRTGVTGGNQDLSASLAKELAHVKEHISVPVFVGFGIRTPEHARTVGKIADGVIVGSAFVDCIEKAGTEAEAKEQMVELAASLRLALDEAVS
jgi:tryptophan synthase alpha chain